MTRQSLLKRTFSKSKLSTKKQKKIKKTVKSFFVKVVSLNKNNKQTLLKTQRKVPKRST